MKSKLLFIFASLLLSSCWRSESPRSFVRPVKLADAMSLDFYDKDFVGVVGSEQTTNLAFQVDGLISNIFVSAGSSVKKGQVLAEIDPQDYILQLQSDKAQFQSAKLILERNERLLARQAISTQDAEIARANFQKAKSAYEYSQNQVAYTRLRAPFSGSIEAKFVEVFQKVSVGEKVFKLINPASLDVSFILPETNINMIQVASDYSVEFENAKGKSYKARVKEVVDASVDGMGIPVSLAIIDPNFDATKLNIKAGFACRVKVSLQSNNTTFRNYVKVPVTSVFVENVPDSSKYVWVYDPQSSTVSKREVTTRGLMGTNDAIVASGLMSGERVVTAGVFQLIDNQKVTVLK